MALCDRCINKGNCGAQEFFEEGKLLLSHCRNFVGEKPREIKTNFQRITASTEALAKFAEHFANCSDDCPVSNKNICEYKCKKCKEALLAWLKQESK